MATVKIGIVSIGEMGAGIASLLVAHGFPVYTNITGRRYLHHLVLLGENPNSCSEHTYNRARAANIELLDSDEQLVETVDYLLAIVPPRDALATAQRFWSLPAKPTDKQLHYLDLNAISPALARTIATEFTHHSPGTKFIDGGIIGGPPKQKHENESTWTRPAIPISGPELPDARLADVLNTRYLGPRIGQASGLKCCFGSLIKGLLAISYQSFSTAHAMGIYPELQSLLESFQPGLQSSITRMIVETPPKTGRWVDEMVEIGRCFGEEGGWDAASHGNGQGGADVYAQVAEVYRTVAEQTVLGRERPEHRERGTTAEDLAAAVAEGLKMP
ncbi:6-phosphogluconate dehydrogenase C-terminal domain-like protein [Aspergillus tubingensis]|uniref:6-phosphogluconate dehydrogenase C-terminal domain-like protein n=1 Tax=Aspergillus niger TaxID=5061 RepID=A0A100IQM1_ASPNG|nr:6-phosphogluconate dehydrogenase C-terminal domain-like protein [Aspergillus tubingensis]GAQ45574.1 hypothetical protein PFICI_02461 [Aspergillus niger]GFN11519.1 6-phosphogluconate dehydrogenase C-terminal domain-like protein [Aspergillus tubingensis]